MITWLDNIPLQFGLTSEEFVFVSIGLFFLAWAVTFILILFSSRVLKSHYVKKEQRLSFQFQKILNTIIINETISTQDEPQSAFEYRMAELRTLMGGASFNRQVLIDQIIRIEKSLSGSSAKALIATYRALDLHLHSLSKLKGFDWKKKSQGIRELTEMNYREALPLIVRFLGSKNQTLREESFMSMVRLHTKPLSFLNDYQHELTPWMRINIHHYLARLDVRTLPDFSQWYNHTNVSVILFSVSMVRQFRQFHAVEKLVSLLKHNDERVVGLTIETLGEMEVDAADAVASLSDIVWKKGKLSRRLVRCLGRIGDPERHGSAVAQFLNHPLYDVRFEAASALKRMKAQRYDELKNDANQPLQNIIRHLEEPLLH
jgi:hypothetical protein